MKRVRLLNTGIIICALFLTIFLVACGSDGQAGTTDADIAIAVALTQTAVALSENETAVATATVAAASVTEIDDVPSDEGGDATPPNEESTATETDAVLTLNGVTLHYDPAVYGPFDPPSLQPRQEADPNSGWGGQVEMISFPIDATAGGFPLSIDIFSVDEFLGLFPDQWQRVDFLKELLAEQPIEIPAPELPYLPEPRAAQMFYAHPHYVPFANGVGIAYLTQYAQAVMPIGEGMYYTIQGLTTDGRYYINARFPVTAAGIDPSNFDYMTIGSDPELYDAYFTETLAKLDQLPADAFTPRLEAWDELISGLAVTPDGSFPSPGGPTAAIERCENDAAFVTDVTIPDNTEIAHDTQFVKTWRLRNTGSCPWVFGGYTPHFVSGDKKLGIQSYLMEPATVAPGQEADVSVTMTAPYDAGRYTGTWRMVSPARRYFGPDFYMVIEVPLTDTNQPVTDVPGYGVIRGAITYPSEGIPAMTIYFIDINDSTGQFALQTQEGWQTYENELPAGQYYVFARPTGDTSDFGGGYTKAVPCGVTADCTDHALLPVTIFAGKVTENIDLTDWYAEPGQFPFP